jgi:hypothetical protein
VASPAVHQITTFLGSRVDEKWDHESPRIDLVCRACTSREVCKAMVDAEKQVYSSLVSWSDKHSSFRSILVDLFSLLLVHLQALVRLVIPSLFI